MQSIPHTVLIIDDSPEDRLVCRRFLERDMAASYRCIEATTAADALVRCREQMPEVVLLDYMLPDEDGLTVLAALIAEHGPHAFALLLLTGAGDQQLAAAAMKLGAHDYLVKDAQLEYQLSRAVAGAIEKVSLQRDLMQERQALADRNAQLVVSNAQLQQALTTVSIERQLLNVTLASIGDGVITTDAQGRITFLNGEAERLTGWPSAEAAGQPLSAVFRILNEDTRAPVDDPAAKVLHTGLVVRLANHTVLIARDGREIPIDDSVAPIRHQGQAIEGVVLVFRDVSERQQAQTALRASEEHFRLIVEGAQDYALYMLTPDGNIASWNSGAARLKGYTADEILGHHFSCVYNAEDAARGWPTQLLKTAVAKGNVEDEGWRVRKDGTRFWASTTISVLHDDVGRLRGFSKLTRDMTERKQAEQDLRESEERFRQLAESLPQLVWTCAPDGPCDYLSQQWLTYTGVPEQAQLGFGWLDQLHPDDRAPTVAAWNAAVAAGTDFHTEFRIRRHDGMYRWFDTRALRLTDSAGHLVKWVGANTDITERREAEQAMERSAARQQVLADASHIFAAAGGDTQALLDQVARIFAERLRAACSIRLLSDDGEYLDTAAIGHYDAAELPAMRESLVPWRIHLDDRVPAAIAARTGQSQFVPAIDREALRATLPPERQGMLARFFPHSLIVTPLRLSGHSIGSLMLARNADDLPAFDVDDLSLAQDLTDRAALAIANARLLQQIQVELAERTAAEAQLGYQANLLSQVSDAIISTDISFTIKSWNAAAEALYGWQDHEVIGKAMSAIVPTAYADGDGSQVRAAFLREGCWQGEVEQQTKDGERRSILSSVSLLRDDSGQPIGAVAVNRDITKRKQAERALERSNQCLQILAEASGAFARSGDDYQGLLDQIARIVGQSLAAATTIHLLSQDEQWLDTVTMFLQNPALEQQARFLFGHLAVDENISFPFVKVIRSGEPLLIPVIEVDPERSTWFVKTELYQRFPPHSTIAVPLLAQGRVIGSLGLYRADPELPPFTEDDLSMAQDLAARAALAIGNARLLQQVQHELAERTQAEQALERSNQRLLVLADASRAFAEAGTDYQSLLDQIVRTTAEHLDAGCVINMLSDDRQWLIPAMVYDRDPAMQLILQKLFGKVRIHIQEPNMTAAVFREKQPILIPCVDPEAIRAAVPDDQWQIFEMLHPRSVITTPLEAQGHRLGTMSFVRCQSEQPFTKDDLMLAQNIGDRAALAIGNARLLQQVQRAANRLEHLRAIDQAILASRSLTEIAEAAVAHIGQLIPTMRVGVLLYDAGTHMVTALALHVYGVMQLPAVPQAPLAIFGPGADLVVRGQTYHVVDVDSQPELQEFIRLTRTSELRSYFLMPIMAADALVGLLNVGADTPHAFTSEHIEIAREVADQLSIAFQQARLREQIAHHAQELEQRVAARTAELTAANQELEAFSYSVSHDLRAPLRAVDGFSRILQEEYIAGLPDEAQHYFGMLRKGAQQMGHLIDDLLAFSRLSRQPLSKQSVDPAEQVRQCLQELGQEQDGRRIEIAIGELPICQGDPGVLKQIWVNLLANALKYTRQRDPARITIGSRPKDSQTIYFVKDNGVGFDMRYSDKLFGVFQRLHRTEDYEGTGVGLAIVQRIIHRHGGRIWADAAVDQGATFYFTLGETYHD